MKLNNRNGSVSMKGNGFENAFFGSRDYVPQFYIVQQDAGAALTGG
jgi:hypothetical protein